MDYFYNFPAKRFVLREDGPGFCPSAMPERTPFEPNFGKGSENEDRIEQIRSFFMSSASYLSVKVVKKSVIRVIKRLLVTFY